MTLKGLIREYVLPPAISALVRPPRRYGAWGRYESWAAAAAASNPNKSSFNSFEIVESELQDVMNGDDAPCFNGIHLAALLSLPPPIKVLDFGGGVGVAYAKAKQVIPGRIKWWRIVDLPEVVERKKKFGADKTISFHTTIDAALAGEHPDLVTCSSVLQLIEDPYEVLENLFSIGAKHIVLDRLPLEEKEGFAVFHATAGHSVPWRIFSRERLQSAARGYNLFFQQTLPKHPTAPDASLEYCLFYIEASHFKSNAWCSAE